MDAAVRAEVPQHVQHHAANWPREWRRPSDAVGCQCPDRWLSASSASFPTLFGRRDVEQPHENASALRPACRPIAVSSSDCAARLSGHFRHFNRQGEIFLFDFLKEPRLLIFNFFWQVKRRKDGRKHGRERPRTVHIDVYCTASESETETCRESDESNESNTSTGQTVLRADQIGTRVRHVRKKNSLPHGLAAKNGSGPALKPVLSYRISTKELAEAVERKRRSSKTTDVSDLLDDELFRDLTLTDSSVRSLLADSEPESSDTRFSEDSILDAQEADRTWRSPEKERKRKMLEQRKQQWRAAKSAEALEQVGRLACRDISMRPTSSVDTTLHSAAYELREKFQRQLRGIQAGSERVSRCNSQRCPTLNQTPPPPLSRESSSAASVPSSCRHSLAVTTPSLCSSPAGSCSVTDSCSSMDVPVAQCEPPKFELPWQWRVQQPASPLKSPVGMSPSNWTLKKFGRHVGPARNPDCTCAHCIDHFNRVGPFKKSGIIAS